MPVASCVFLHLLYTLDYTHSSHEARLALFSDRRTREGLVLHQGLASEKKFGNGALRINERDPPPTAIPRDSEFKTFKA